MSTESLTDARRLAYTFPHEAQEPSGRARMNKLTAEERTNLARQAANVRWEKTKGKSESNRKGGST
jgi:hypothetical protein